MIFRLNPAQGGAGVILALLASVSAQAQETDLSSLGKSELRQEITARFDEALALSNDPAIRAADDSRYDWALQAKAQCGIALGFLKSGERDPVSIGKCDDASRRMRLAPRAVAVASPAAPPPLLPACGEKLAGTIFFDWNSSAVPASAQSNLASIVESHKTCGWTRMVVTGHTDRSGSDAYNNALSMRRANGIAGVLGQMGISAAHLEVSGLGETTPRVPTADGERNPANRRVEVTVK